MAGIRPILNHYGLRQKSYNDWVGFKCYICCMISMVYTVFNTINGKFYIGKSNNPVKRWNGHNNLALQGSTECPKFYAAIRKYGINTFVYSIIQEFSSEEAALEAESYYIVFFDSIINGYNCLEDVDSRIGYITTEDTKNKQSVSRIKFYETHSHYYYGKLRDEDTKQKISKTLTGKFFGEKAGNSKLTNIQRLEIIKLSDSGLSQREISKLFNISQWSIFNVLKHRDKYED
jgi:group I intron endonuclease